jgi:hypothetical protein
MEEMEVYEHMHAIASASNESVTGISNTVAVFWRHNKLVEKAGLGLIQQGLFVDLKALTNTIIGIDGPIWTGKGSDNEEAIFIVKSKVYSSDALPADFSIADVIMVMFEKDKIYVIDMGKFTGGYYNRNG